VKTHGEHSLAFARYTLAGGAATAAHYALLVALVEGLRMDAASAAALGALAGAVVAYAANRRFTFTRSRAGHRRALPRFLLVAAMTMALSASIVRLGTVAWGLHYLLAQALATGVGLVLGYGLNRHWTFR
jgi:putative flippase GtrA